MSNKSREENESFDAIVVGAGFAGLCMLHRLKQIGLSVKSFEVGTGVGGTWYWNRYPGARCDVESWEYSYGFSEELEQEWNGPKDTLRNQRFLLLKHVGRKLIYMIALTSTPVKSAIFDEDQKKWVIQTDCSKTSYTAKYCIMATGCLSSANIPQIEGFTDYQGESFHTGN